MKYGKRCAGAALATTIVLLLPIPARAASSSELRSLERYHLRAATKAWTTLQFFEHHPKLLYAKRTKRHAWHVVALARHRYIGEKAKLRAVRARLASAAMPHRALWLCVHQHEQTAWNDSGAPYWGGLQMGSWFIATYGGSLLKTKGTPDHWTPQEQMSVAERAFQREGLSVAWFNGQWPPSAGRCGL